MTGRKWTTATAKYLLTNEVIETEAEAWRVVLAYARRWQIEMAFRYGKSELAMESPRLWTWERRLKLLLLVTLAYAFGLTMQLTELSLPVAAVFAILLTTIAAFCVGAICVRLSTDYFAFITLAVQMLFFSVIISWPSNCIPTVSNST